MLYTKSGEPGNFNTSLSYNKNKYYHFQWCHSQDLLLFESHSGEQRRIWRTILRHMKSLTTDWEAGSLKTDLTCSGDFIIEGSRDLDKIIYLISDKNNTIDILGHPRKQTWLNRTDAPNLCFNPDDKVNYVNFCTLCDKKNIYYKKSKKIAYFQLIKIFESIRFFPEMDSSLILILVYRGLYWFILV